MASRMKIILFSAIPVGASIFYLLWTYTWKKRSSRNRDIELKKTPPLPVSSNGCDFIVPTESNETLLEDGESIRSARNASESDAGHFSLSDETDLLSSSRGHSPAGELVDLQHLCPHMNSPSALVLAVENAVDYVAGGDLQPNRNVNDLEVNGGCSSVGACMEIIETKESQWDGLSRNTTDNVVKVEKMTTYDSACTPSESVIVEELVEAVACQPVSSEPTLTSTLGDVNSYQSEKCSWGNSPMPDSADSEMVCENDVRNDTAVCTTARKDSINSVSGENSRNSSKDRNDNCRRNNKKNQSSNQKSSQVDDNSLKSHAFDFPTEFCGQLIGRRGHNVAMIKEKCGVEIYIRPKMYNSALQVVTLEGSRQQINKGLDMIRRKFPVKFFPGVDFDRCLPDVPFVSAELMQLTLPTGVPIEVVVCCVVTPNHVFVQQPTHPSFPSLERQTISMQKCYSVEDVPCLPRPIDVGVICAAPMGINWHRAQVVQTYEDTDEYDLKLVDFGGYVHMSGSMLRQIRSDFMLVPFQAIECYLANVIPLKDDDEFVPEAREVLEELVRGSILQCMVTAIEGDGVPYVVLTKLSDKGRQAVVVNRELVNRELARWLEM